MTMQMDSREAACQEWFDECLQRLWPQKDWRCAAGRWAPASSDASFRRYFRWELAGTSFVIMDAPPPQEDCRPFVQVAQMLASAGVPVPEVLAQDIERGYLLLSDLGKQTYLDVLTSANADMLFAEAVQALLAQQHCAVPAGFAEYDRALLERELQLFPEWYLGRHLGLDVAQWQARLRPLFDTLIDSALAQPQVLVHRDFMPRNLMLSLPNPGVLDFQDAVLGPITYDITSLFKDAFISWPQARVDAWINSYWRQAQAAGLPVAAEFADFLQASDLMGAQRHLKVIGIFARICHRDGKPKYLADVPRFFNYLREVCVRRPELAAQMSWLEEIATMPAAEVSA
nr:phosphotransferase [Atopomonas sediminilitoris]